MITVTIVLLAGVTAVTALRKRSAALRHWVLAASIVCAAAAPAAEVLGPSWHVAAVPSLNVSTIGSLAFVDDPSLVTGGAAATRRGIPATAAGLLAWAGVVWSLGAAVNVGMLLAGIVWLAWVASRARRLTGDRWQRAVAEISRRYGLSRPVRLLMSDRPALLVTWGVRRPTIIVPRDALAWSDNRVRIVLGHELAHVRRADWLVQLLAECLKCFYWFNPLAWVACRRLRGESEQACDDEVLRLGVAPSDYASQLLDLARAFRRGRGALLAAPAMARPSHLERRVSAMLNDRLDRARVSRGAYLAIPLVLVVLTVSVAGFVPSTGRAPAGPPSVAELPRLVATTAAPAWLTPAAAMSAAIETRPANGVDKPARALRPDSVALPAGLAADVPAAIEQSTASYSGTLIDETGRAMPSVQVTIANADAGVNAQLVTDAAGRFSVSGLAAGEYQVSAGKPGFSTYRARVTLAPGQVLQEHIEMRLGMLAETVVVSGQMSNTGGLPSDSGVPVPREIGRAPVDDPCTRSEAGGCVTPPIKLRHAAPRYPGQLLAAGKAGEVVIEGRVRADGSVGDLQAVRSADPGFTAAVEEAIRLWQFSPTRLNGTPVEVKMTVTVAFMLR